MAFGLLGKGSQLVFKAIGKITGGEFLDDLAGFIAAINDLFGGFTERAKRVSEALRSPDVAFVLVTSPDPMAIEEINFFAERLRAFAMPRDAYVINRVHMPPEGDGHGIPEALALDDLPQELATAGHRPRERRRAPARPRDAHTIERSGLDEGDKTTVVVQVPAFDGDVHDVTALTLVGEALVGAPTPR